MKALKKLFVAIIIFLIPLSFLDANVITVSLSGDGDYTSINNALSVAVPGDTIKILYNETFNETLVFTAGQSNITIEGSAEGKPTIYDPSGDIFSVNEANITLRNLIIRIGASGNNVSGIYLTGRNVHIDNCVISAETGASNCYGIRAVNNVDNLIVENCDIGYNLYAGIYLDTIPAANTIHIQNNKIHDTITYGIYIYPDAAYNADTYIVKNVIYNIGGDGIRFEINSGKQKIFYNTIYNANGDGLYIRNQTGNTYIYNNTLVNNYNNGLKIFINNSGSSYNIYNNIAYYNNYDDFNIESISPTNSGTITNGFNNYNTIFENYLDNIAYTKTQNINDNPSFVDYMNHNYDLQATSPCIDSGNNDLVAYYQSEGYNFAYNGHIDRGAHEYFPSAATASASAEETHTMSVSLSKNNFNPGDKVSIKIDKFNNITSSEKIFVKVNIFNINGKKVKTLVKDLIESSSALSFQWDGKDDNNNYVPSGLYLITVSAGDTTTYKQIFWIR